jgi:nitroreductase
MEFSDVLRTRKSVRGFQKRPVPRDVLTAVLAAAQRAPSWCNIQPWRVYVTAGAVTERLTAGYVVSSRAMPMAP